MDLDKNSEAVTALLNQQCVHINDIICDIIIMPIIHKYVVHNSGSQIRRLIEWEMQIILQPNLQQILYV